MNQFKRLVRTLLTRLMLYSLLGNHNRPYLEALVENAKHDNPTFFAQKAELYRHFKSQHGDHLNYNELNLAVELVISLSEETA